MVTTEMVLGFLDLDPQVVPGGFLFGAVLGLLRCLRGGFLYWRSYGAADGVANAKNKTIYGLRTVAASSASALILWLVAGGPTTAQIFRGMALGAVVSAGMWLLLSRAVVPTAVAAYSAWWMPKAERTAHRQDIRYALRQAEGGRRSSHAWGVLKSSPRVGLRARRHHKRLAAAMTGSPARMRVSS
jgi:hypothetical protein